MDRRWRGALVAALVFVLVAGVAWYYAAAPSGTENQQLQGQQSAAGGPGLIDRLGRAAKHAVGGGSDKAKAEPVSAGLAVSRQLPPGEKSNEWVVSTPSRYGPSVIAYRKFQVRDPQPDPRPHPGPGGSAPGTAGRRAVVQDGREMGRSRGAHHRRGCPGRRHDRRGRRHRRRGHPRRPGLVRRCGSDVPRRLGAVVRIA